MSIKFKFIAFKDPHKTLSIHTPNCGHLCKHGGEPIKQEYIGFMSLKSAHTYAELLGYKLIECTACKPNLVML